MPVATVTLVVPAAGDGPIADVSALVGEKTLVLGGSYTGSYTVLASQDGGATFVPVATFDSDGSDPIEQTVPAAFEKMRVRANANTVPSSPVTCTVSGIAVVGANQFAVLASFPPGGGGSVVVDTYLVFPPTGLEDDVAILCSGGFVGTILVEGSPDAASWNAVGSFQAGPSPRPLVGLQAILEFAPLLTQDKVRYLRVTAQGQVQSAVVVTAGGSVAVVAPPSSTTLAEAYDNGLVAADQTIVLRDVFGGGVVVDATSGAFTGPNALSVLAVGGSVLFPREGGLYADSTRSRAAGPAATWDAFHLDDSLLTLTGGPAATASLAMFRVGQGTIDGAANTVSDAYDLFVDAAPTGSATLTRSWSAGFAGAVQGQAGLVLGAGLAPPTESDLVMGAGATVVSQANSGRLGYVAGATQKFVVSMDGAAYVPLVTGDGTLADSYDAGTLAADQTLALLDAKGGGLVVDGTAALFTGSSALRVVVTGGATNFYRVGGFDVASTISKAAAAGTTWNEVSLLSSTLTLTGGPTAVTALSMVRVGAGVINGAGNTVGDAYDLFVEAAPSGTATLSRSWSLGVTGNSRFIGNVGVNTTIAPTARLEVVEGASTSTVGDATNSGSIKITNNDINGPNVVGGLEFQCETSYLGSGQGTGAKFFTHQSQRYLGLAVRRGSASWTGAMVVDLGTGNVNLGSTSLPSASTTLRVMASKTVASAAGASWDGFLVNASTLTLTGATGVTALNFASIGVPTVQAASALVVDDFYTLRLAAAVFGGVGPASVTRSWALGVDGNTKLNGGQAVKGTDVNAAGPYVVLATDYMLEVRYTATGAISINLPSIATVGNGRIVVVIDSGYNALVNNITVVRNGADKIDNAAANYIINVSGSAIWFKANATTNNWEIV